MGLLWNKNMNLLIPIQKKLIDHNIFSEETFLILVFILIIHWTDILRMV